MCNKVCRFFFNLESFDNLSEKNKKSLEKSIKKHYKLSILA